MPRQASRIVRRPKTMDRKSPTVAKLKKTAWKLLSEVVRREAADQYGLVDCYTCGPRHHWKQIQAGHAISGRTGAVLFDEEIIRPQCYACNVPMRGNYQVFVAKLIKENGMEWWDRKLSESRSVVKWSRADLEAKIESYKTRLQAL